MMIAKSAWQRAGKFNESLDHNEDFAFAKKIQAATITIAFAGDAVVGWLPRTNLKSFWQMISRFAMGDMQAGILRPKVVLIFARYILFFALLMWILALNQIDNTNGFFPTMVFVYILWSIWKNKRYAPNSWWYLPLLQVVSDLAVMNGTIQGLFSFKKTND